MIENDFTKIQLFFPERIRLFALRFIKSAPVQFFGKYFDALYRHGFIEAVLNNNLDIFPHLPYGDGMYSLTEKYRRYCVYRREQFFASATWTAIVSSVVSMITSIITVKMMFKLAGISVSLLEVLRFLLQ